MGSTSKDLLQLEHKNPSASSIESALLVCKNGSQAAQTKKAQHEEKHIVTPVPRSQVLGKLRDFLGIMSEANERLKKDAKVNSENYDIEALTGNECQVIEMDLMLGVADLQTPEAVAAAEAAICGHQPVIPLAVSSSEEESDNENSSDDSDEDSDDDEDDASDDKSKKTPSSVKLKTPKSDKVNSPSKKRPKIVELP